MMRVKLWPRILRSPSLNWFTTSRASRSSAKRSNSPTLVSIVQSRVDAGHDPAIELTQAKLTQAQLHLASLRAADEMAVTRDHLARLIGLPPAALSIDSVFPASPAPLDSMADTSLHGYANAAVAAAFASAMAKQQQANGDAHWRFHPQINFFAQYNRYATFTDSFAQLQKLDALNNNGQTALTANEGAFGIQINVPILDRSRAAKARESAADAAHALHDAQNSQLTLWMGRAACAIPSTSCRRRPTWPRSSSSMRSSSSKSCSSNLSRAIRGASR